jgi:hypothetical protein
VLYETRLCIIYVLLMLPIVIINSYPMYVSDESFHTSKTSSQYKKEQTISLLIHLLERATPSGKSKGVAKS